MLADPEGVDAELVGEHALVDHVADRLGRASAARPSGPMVTSPKVSSPNSKFCAIGRVSLLWVSIELCGSIKSGRRGGQAPADV